MKTCIACARSLPLESFYRHPQMKDGRLGRCIECHKSGVQRVRKERHDYYVAYDRMRYERDYEKRKLAVERYRKTEAAKEALKKARASSAVRYPERNTARYALGNAVRDGRVIKPDACEMCGVSGKLHGQHDDYTKPLDVRWLCVPCHTLVHRGERAVIHRRRAQCAET